MKIVKGLVAGILVVCVLAAGLLLFVSLESRHFQSQYAGYVRDFLYELSLTWDPGDVEAQLSPDLRAHLASPAGRHLFRIFRDLGRLEEIRDLELNHYRVTFQEETGVFRCQARFRRADAVVTFTLRADDRGVQVHGLTIRPLGGLRPEDPLAV